MPPKPELGQDVVLPPGLEDLAEAITVMELHFFAQAALAEDAQAVLSEYGYGRAHHRALHFVARQPGITPRDLTAVLGVSSQALAKVMGTMLTDDVIAQTTDLTDRRMRRFTITDKGLALLRQVFAAQARRLSRAVERTSRTDLEGHLRLYGALLEPDIALMPRASAARSTVAQR